MAPLDAVDIQVASLVAGQRDQNLGNSRVLEPGMAATTILQLSVEKVPSATELITVWLKAERESFDAPAIAPAPPIARVEFGAGGSRAGLVELDVPFQGTVLSVPCSSLRVDAQLRPGSIQLDSVRVSSFLGRGVRPGGCGCAPRRTIEVGPALSPAITIPPGAVTLSYFSLGLPATVQWADHAGAVVASFIQGPFDAPSSVPIPSDAQAITFAGLAIGRAVFGVAA